MGLLDDLDNVALGRPADEVRALAALAERQAQEAKLDPLNHGFLPHEGQMKVHRSKAKEILLVAANRFGKTVTGMRETLWRATGTHPYKKVRPHNMIWCGFPDFPFYLRVTQQHFKKWHPRNYLVEWNKTEKWAVFKRKDGGECMVFFLSYDSGEDKWQGGKVDFCWLDEENPKEIYDEATARLVDADGDMLLTQTPVSGLGWVYDEIYEPWERGENTVHVVEGALAEYRPECKCGHHPEVHLDKNKQCLTPGCTCQVFDYAYELGVGRSMVPHLTRARILRWARKIKDPDMRMIRIFGKFRARTGGVYKMFSKDLHVIPAFAIPPHWEVWGGIDPGFHGFAVTIFAQDPFGRVYTIMEFFSQHQTTGERARELWAKLNSIYPVPESEWIVLYVDTEDPQTVMELNNWAQQSETRLAFASLEHGLKARKAGIARIQEMLSPHPLRSSPPMITRPTPPEGEPLLYIFDNLQSVWLHGDSVEVTSRLIWEISRYRWKKHREGKMQKDDADNASAGGGHMLDSWRYGIMARIGPPEEIIVEDDLIDPSDRAARNEIERLHNERMEMLEGI